MLSVFSQIRNIKICEGPNSDKTNIVVKFVICKSNDKLMC